MMCQGRKMYQLVDMFALPEMTLYANVIQVTIHFLLTVYTFYCVCIFCIVATVMECFLQCTWFSASVSVCHISACSWKKHDQSLHLLKSDYLS